MIGAERVNQSAAWQP